MQIDDGNAPLLYIDVHLPADDADCFRETTIWNSWVVIGCGCRLALVHLHTSEVAEVALGSYFAHFYVTPTTLLVTSAERVLSVGADARVQWQSAPLGVDGVIIHDITDSTIHGDGEWDPPGGWRSFTLDRDTGALVQ